MSDGPSRLLIRTAVETDLPSLRRVFRAASLSNPGDKPLLLAHPEFLVFAGDGIAAGRTRVSVEHSGTGALLGFATTVLDQDGQPELEDLFVDPGSRRRGIARDLVLDVVETARQAGHHWLSVTGNPHALAFYRAVGFVEIGPVATELGPGLRLRLDLTKAVPRAE